MRTLTPEQERAVGRRDGSLLVRAGAGTGKTTVLVERFVRAVLEDGAPVDGVLAITFTEKAASEMRTRVRRRFLDLGRREEARASEGAWISTIHGFCSRVLRAHALSAGIDPEYRVLDDLESQRLGLDAFDRALEDFLGHGEDAGRLAMVASYTPDRLRDMVHTAWSLLRSRGQRRPRLEEVSAPRAGGERERLQDALRAVLAELGACAGGAAVERELERLERCGTLLDRLPPDDMADPKELGELVLRGGAKALQTDACEGYREALAAYLSICLAHREALDHTLLRALLDLYGERYEALKRARSGLDFEDLELITRDLLRDDPGLREQYRSRFAHVLVDEFQDTNPLQNELLGLLEDDNLFRVGDENQSIYGFRNADVGVFRDHHERAAAAGRAESITVNFRSRAEVLDAVDLAFARLWGGDFEPLRPPPEAAAAAAGASVELLVVDKHKQRWDERLGQEEPFGPTMHAATPWRACEARLLAKRVDELIREGRFAAGDMVLLLRATTHMTFYERALEERGVPTHVVGGRGYWGQQQVADLRHWLAALANPLDELSVYSVLASPLVGASLDAVALVGLAARESRRDAWWTLRDDAELRERLPERDRSRIADFVTRFEAERRAAPQVSLETLIDRAVTVTGYDRHVLSLPAGDRRMANVRKLMRVAREYEADEGRDLRGFIDFVGERDLIQEREGEAPLEAEDLDAVRLMTVHRAKGLEFPVVCVADLGKDGREDYGALRISEDGRLGLRLASMGGGAVDTERLERLREEQRIADEAEERRIFYVAATRAQEHLILSGATDLQKRREPEPLDEPMRWAWRSFCAGLPAEGASGEHVDAWDGREVRVRWTLCTPDTVDEVLPADDRRPARPVPVEANGHAQPMLELGGVPAPRALPVSRLSYSALQAFKRCSYRFYLQRALGLPGGDRLRIGADPGPEATVEPAVEEPRAADELPALLRGTLVHELLERMDLRSAEPPAREEVEAALERHGVDVRVEDVADLSGMAAAFARSRLRERLGGARRVRTELPFAFTLSPPGARGRTLLVNGVVDVHAVEEDGGTLILDYKSDRLDGRDPREVGAEDYGIQRLVYALAALRAGAPKVDVIHCFLERPDEPAVATYEAADADRLEAELLALARGVVEGSFVPTSEPSRDLCADCPGQPALCSWEPDRTLSDVR
ncbi:MAG TPA: UvrD-helicase domain-containing protein [Thermoleophilaceae bacterium]